jgi:mRNA interferase MazF
LVKRGDIWLADLDPTVGSEIRKRRPCLIVSPPEIHDHWRTVIVAPMTTGARPAPYRIPSSFEGQLGLVHLDQIRTLDRARLVRCLGAAAPQTLAEALDALREMFAE